MKTFVQSQFNYRPLIQKLHSRTLNNKIYRLYEKALRIVYSDYKSSFITTAQKMKFSIKDFFNKCNQIPIILLGWSHLLKKSLMKNFIFCGVYTP